MYMFVSPCTCMYLVLIYDSYCFIRVVFKLMYISSILISTTGNCVV